MKSLDRYRLHESLGYQLSVVSRIQERRLDEGLKTLGLTRITWCVLLAVGNEDLQNPSAISDFVGVDRTATSRALRQMEAENLIARQPGAGDRRTTAVRLTERGRATLEAGTPFARDNNATMEERLSPNELKSLRQLLSKIQAGEDTPLPGL